MQHACHLLGNWQRFLQQGNGMHDCGAVPRQCPVHAAVLFCSGTPRQQLQPLGKRHPVPIITMRISIQQAFKRSSAAVRGEGPACGAGIPVEQPCCWLPRRPHAGPKDAMLDACAISWPAPPRTMPSSAPEASGAQLRRPVHVPERSAPGQRPCRRRYRRQRCERRGAGAGAGPSAFATLTAQDAPCSAHERNALYNCEHSQRALVLTVKACPQLLQEALKLRSRDVHLMCRLSRALRARDSAAGTRLR